MRLVIRTKVKSVPVVQIGSDGKELFGNLRYEMMAEVLHDQAFHYCVSHLYPFFKFRIIQPDQVTRADIAEKLYKYNDWLALDRHKYGNSMGCYAHLLDSYIKAYTNCKSESRNDRYRSHGLSLFKYDNPEGQNVTELKDKLMIFLSIMRLHHDPRQWGREIADDADFCLRLDDAKILQQIHGQAAGTPEFLLEKKQFEDVNLTLNEDARKQRKNDIDTRSDYFYMVSLILLEIALQDRGILE